MSHIIRLILLSITIYEVYTMSKHNNLNIQKGTPKIDVIRDYTDKNREKNCTKEEAFINGEKDWIFCKGRGSEF